ncbi:hypothetical protein I6F36_30005 [Bradyrhizobium sp. BRP19]|uniref:hypothetical protein n=1 Tax=Bradyrhizobium sp. BRP19 TaxID=2793823 RepID=UPI001CD7FEE4|nr:hypothetical protein [Bradyrhizobium sp. BRP19]MCA1551070.1 hypothetical protein [Bradyrhizobium sp. BRP19]
MTDEIFTMKRSRSQLATIYAPGAFFTFEGGMGACIAQPAARIEAKLSEMLKNQVLDTINERVRNWEIQGLNCRRPAGQPPVDPELVLDPQLRNDDGAPRLRGDRLAFLVPDVMNYIPEPLTFVCRRCGLLKDFGGVEEFETKSGTLEDGCPHRMQDEPCRSNWEQLDVVQVHWSGGYHRVSTLYNRWDRDRQDIVWNRVQCHCGNSHYLLDRSSPVFSKWRLICSACKSATKLPVLKDPTSLRVLGDGLNQGSNQQVEVNMEPVSYRANNAYYVQGDRVLALANEDYFPLLLRSRTEELKGFIAKAFAYPVAAISEADIENTLREKNRATEWLSYKNHAEIIAMMRGMKREDLAEASVKARQDQLDRWRTEGLIPDVYQRTPALDYAVDIRAEQWDRKFDPIRQAVEHKTLEIDVLNDADKVINVREPKDPILPDMSPDEVETTKSQVSNVLSMLGIEDMRLVRKFPVCEFTFGYSRVESGPRVSRDKTGEMWEMPVKLNLFPRAYFHEEHVQPIYVMRQDNEAFYVRLDESCVRAWLDANGITYELPAPTSRLGAAIIDGYHTTRPEGGGFSSWLDEYRGNATPESRNLCSYVYTLLHTMAHQMMHSVAQVSGLELGSLTEHIFLPDLAFVVYRRGTTMDLGYLSSAWRMATNATDGNLVLSSMLDPTSLRCGSGALCDERGGACPDCILIPEVCCISRNNLLSRSVLRGMAKPHWDVAIPRDQAIEGYFDVVRRTRRSAEQRNAAA